jgi:hypothetical protein
MDKRLHQVTVSAMISAAQSTCTAGRSVALTDCRVPESRKPCCSYGRGHDQMHSIDPDYLSRQSQWLLHSFFSQYLVKHVNLKNI